jgi:hypothetical protein
MGFCSGEISVLILTDQANQLSGTVAGKLDRMAEMEGAVAKLGDNCEGDAGKHI